ncbi:hypothetical protein PG997_011608 [Apiospora hydei]|uniref:Uncharacterized protein n=1 Tax=Apiospora hydei TaxID=1337664 RepID=A0ABR1VMG7_9PEZI
MENPAWTVRKYFPEGCYGTHWVNIRQFGPEWAFHITKAPYEKAERRNADLSDGARALLLSRGDTVGKALVHPESLTLAERYEVLGWGPPETLQPRELLDKACASAPAYESLPPDELELLILGFQPSLEVYKETRRWHMFPGNQEARNLVWARQEGVDAAAASCKELPQTVLSDSGWETGLLVQELPPLGCRHGPYEPLIPLPPQSPAPPRAETSFSLPAVTTTPQEVQPTTAAAAVVAAALLVSPMDWMLRVHDRAYPPPPLSIQSQDDLMKWLGVLQEVMGKGKHDDMTDEEIAGLEAHPEQLNQEARDQLARTKDERRRDPEFITNAFEKNFASLMEVTELSSFLITVSISSSSRALSDSSSKKYHCSYFAGFAAGGSTADDPGMLNLAGGRIAAHAAPANGRV